MRRTGLFPAGVGARGSSNAGDAGPSHRPTPEEMLQRARENPAAQDLLRARLYATGAAAGPHRTSGKAHHSRELTASRTPKIAPAERERLVGQSGSSSSVASSSGLPQVQVGGGSSLHRKPVLDREAELKEILAPPAPKHAELMLSRPGSGRPRLPSLRPDRVAEVERLQKQSATTYSSSFAPSVPYEASPFAFIDKVKRNPDTLEFVYLNNVLEDPTRDAYNPYSLMIVSHSERNPHSYYTMSASGVTHFIGGEAEFTPLDQWIREYEKFSCIAGINFFKKFKVWRCFFQLKMHARLKRGNYCRDFLDANLFHLHDELSSSLLDVRRHCVRLSNLRFFKKAARSETQSLEAFYSTQVGAMEQIKQTMRSLTMSIKDCVTTGCRAFMDAARFSSGLDEDGPDEAPARGLTESAMNAPRAVFGDNKPSMSYTDLAARRALSKRLANFIRLADYLVVNALERMCVESVGNLVEAMQELFAKINDPDVEEVVEEDYTSTSKPKMVPLFLVEIVFADDSLMPSPDNLEFQERIGSLLRDYVESVTSLDRLREEEAFEPYVVPMAEKKDVDPLGEGPDLEQLVLKNPLYQERAQRLSEILQVNSDRVIEYTAEFEHFRKYYLENRKLDIARLKEQDLPLDFFRDAMDTYKRQAGEIAKMRIRRNLGVFMVETTRLQEILAPSPERCLQGIRDLLPVLAREKTKMFHDNVVHAHDNIANQPAVIDDFVRFLDHLEDVNRRLGDFEQKFGDIKEIYALIEDRKIPVTQEELAFFKGQTTTKFNLLKETFDMAEGSKDDDTSRFIVELENEVDNLKNSVDKIVDRSRHEMVGDPDEDTDRVLGFIGGLQGELQSQRDRSEKLVEFQQRLNLPPERFQIVDDAVQLVGQKYKLWKSLKDWTQSVETWREQIFRDIDAEDIDMEVQKYMRTANQVVKSLPENRVGPKFQKMVERFREVVPVMVDLCNPDLRAKASHMAEVNIVLGVDVLSEELTVGALIDTDLVAKKEDIARLALQASQLAALEELLQKVVVVWESTEYPLALHGSQHILGGLDEIIDQLDDSRMTIGTILGSRFVGPIKNKVESWDQNLSLMSKTLKEWMDCQRDWLYLESIFQSSEIQKHLEQEHAMFKKVDKTFREIMKRTFDNPKALSASIAPGMYDKLKDCNSSLAIIQRKLEQFLERKRNGFPRFYFLSNEDLIAILARANEPEVVQPYLSKCFDGIDRLRFGEDGIAIKEMLSAEGESVSMGKNLAARGPVERWLTDVEERMMVALRDCMHKAVVDFPDHDFEDWMLQHPSQICLTVAQIFWAMDVEKCLSTPHGNAELRRFRGKNQELLNRLAAMTRRELERRHRITLGAMIVVNVHSRDVVKNMVEEGVAEVFNFGWQKQLRYYWEEDPNSGRDDCFVRQSNSRFLYGYEYMGAQPRLVITPLTDRIYMTLTGALQLKLGGAPAGPAGTGKTETTKDLAKSLGRQCVVYNCSEGVTYHMMAMFFSGLIQAGAWCCFDEFNRIGIEVLSVIATQLLQIRTALLRSATNMTFEGKELRVRPTVGFFITMNPGYAGRTELPDNLKTLFRPVACMIPDYRMIAEVSLYSEGYENAEVLSNKMTQLYKLSSEQLSKQGHYDFGMRAVKSVLVMAGSLKRENPDIHEDLLLIRAMRDSNIPKFLAHDVPLFQAIVSDLFPGVELPEHDYGEFMQAMEHEMEERGLQKVPAFITKIVQLFETLNVRHGVMLVGPTGGGKTVCRSVLSKSMSILREERNSANPIFQRVQVSELNPKSITYAELYGAYNLLSQEWSDGIVPKLARAATRDESADYKWIVFDGPVDTLWIESMNSVLDDSKLLCLDNAERIKLKNTIRLMFEVEDLAEASPATVSRCGMVYIDPEELGWRPIVRTWLATRASEHIPAGLLPHLEELFDKHVDSGLHFVRRSCKFDVETVDINLVQSLCDLFMSLMVSDAMQPLKYSESDMETTKRSQRLINLMFVFSYVWALGGNCNTQTQDSFDSFCQQQFESFGLPVTGSVFDFCVNLQRAQFEKWEDHVQPFRYDPELPFFRILVPTVDTVRFSFLIKSLLRVNKPVLINGNTGVGKSAMVVDALSRFSEELQLDYSTVQFSAQTSSGRTQEMIEMKLDKRRTGVIGPRPGRRMAIFVDDLNMPQKEKFGAQPPIELLRQLLGDHGFYDRSELVWKEVEDVSLVAACGPPGGGRNPVTQRLVRFFHCLCVPDLSDNSMIRIFQNILSGFLQPFVPDVREKCVSVVKASVELFQKIRKELLPTPTRSHYTFNLRDLSKVFQGILQVQPRYVSSLESFVRLWIHETTRSFHDRLIDTGDRFIFQEIMVDLTRRHMGLSWSQEDIFGSPIIFANFSHSEVAPEDRVYEEMTEITKLPSILGDYLDDHNMVLPEMKLVFFTEAVEHICRISRVLSQPRGNALLVGVGGSGKRSLTKLAAFICQYEVFQIGMRRDYGPAQFREDLKSVYKVAGLEGRPLVFIFADSQITNEGFLEDINNVLNSGEVPNLYEQDEREQIINMLREDTRKAGWPEDRDSIWAFFVHRFRENLHIVLCMSPVGDAFRNRVRMFPSLVNCCTIDWFDEWPEEALLSVSESFLLSHQVVEESLVPKYSRLCVTVHQSVAHMAHRFFEEMRRHYYVTPTSYLEFIALYGTLLKEKTGEITQARDRLYVGLQTLKDAEDKIEVMRDNLEKLQPILVAKSKETKELLEVVTKEKAQADEQRAAVAAEEAEVNAKTAEAEAIKAAAKEEFDKALPLLREAEKALSSLNKSAFAEVRAYAQPPAMVKLVMEAVLTLFGERKPDWDLACKKYLADANFLNNCKNFPRDDISEATLRKLQVYINDERFTKAFIEGVSVAAASLCVWVHALNRYAYVSRDVEPLQRRLAEAEASAAEMQAILDVKQSELRKIQAHVAELEATLDRTQREKQDLQDQTDLSKKRLERAGVLTTSLAGEKTRWISDAERYSDMLVQLPGDVFLGAAAVAYFGAFSGVYRRELLQEWRKEALDVGISLSESFDLGKVLSDQVQIRDWMIWGLPNDPLSVENGVLTTRSQRWPLMIDPQGQANHWIRNMEAENNLKVLKMGQDKYLQQIENAMRIGQPVLVEDVGETLDPALDTLLARQIIKLKGGRQVIHFVGKDVDYDENFRFYMTSKLSNPHYLPEVCIKVTIINFTVTVKGLEDQLLADVVQQEEPELEESKNKLILKVAAFKRQLKDIEDKILREINSNEGEILDNEALINTLDESKHTSDAIGERVAEAEITEAEINKARETYRKVAVRGSILYFVVADLGLIDPMYQYSLEFFKALFLNTIANSEQLEDKEAKLDLYIDNITQAVYTNVCRGLFEQHKPMFSFLMCTSVLRERHEISAEEWNFFLRGRTLATAELLKPNPDPSRFPDRVWEMLCVADHYLSAFTGICSAIKSNLDEWSEFSVSESIHRDEMPSWCAHLSPFQRLLLIFSLRDEKLFFGVFEFVRVVFGEHFIKAPEFDLHDTWLSTDISTPVIFILSTGADPTSNLMRYAADCEKELHVVSLGQGQEEKALNQIEAAKREGDWVLFQNCHVAVSFLPEIEKKLSELSEAKKMGSLRVNDEFRLWMTSMPSPDFPIPILQNGVKLTIEPPKGLKANLLRSYKSTEESYFRSFEDGEQFPQCSKKHAFLKLLFGLRFFHAVIQERKKFGPLGWNVLYEFNDSDLDVSQQWLHMLLSEQREIPWESLLYVIGEINYGGRVTDSWDRRCLLAILRRFFRPELLDDSFTFSESGLYRAPSDGPLESYVEYVEALSREDPPEVFGMHENANITNQRQESNRMFTTIMSIQPRIGASGGGASEEELAFDMAETILSQVPEDLSKEEAHHGIFHVNEQGLMHSLSTVLSHEMARFNNLLGTMRSNLKELKLALRGLVVLSADLDMLMRSLMNNQVPLMWSSSKAGYESLKPLGSWVKDLLERVAALRRWLQHGTPSSFWISGLFFPQGFLTGVLQTHARKHVVPIDTLIFRFEVFDLDAEEVQEGPEDGVYVHGLFMDGARWDRKARLIADQKKGEMFSPMPVVHFLPTTSARQKDGYYVCPLYKTSVRKGTLSTTGHSTNYILDLSIPSNQPEDFWILKGTALLCQLDD